MTAHEWFQSYLDAVSVSSLLMQCATYTQAERFTSRTMLAYTAAKGPEYAESVQRQVNLLLQGVQASVHQRLAEFQERMRRAQEREG